MVGPLLVLTTMLVDTGYDHVTGAIIGAAIEVHRHLGPGLLESSYLPCMHYELRARRIRFAVQRPVPLVYKGVTLDTPYRLDLIVEDAVVVEVKSVERLVPVHDAQILTYMRLTECPVGLLINFNVQTLKDGVRRLLAPRRRQPPSIDPADR